MTKDVHNLIDSCAAWDAHGVTPIGGGWMAQSRLWARRVRIIGSERALIEEERRERMKKQ